MRLHLQTSDPRPLMDALSLVSHLRRKVYIRFSTSVVAVILVDETVGSQPQLWAKIQTKAVFDHISIQCDRVSIAVEINADSLLLALHNYERSHCQCLTLRLQKNTLGGAISKSTKGRNANLCLSYVEEESEIVHSFRVPAKVLRSSHQAFLLREPEVSQIQFMILLPNSFAHVFRRLERFKVLSPTDVITLRATHTNNSGSLGIQFEREGQFVVTLSWNESLQFLKPIENDPDSGTSSLGYSLHQTERLFEDVSEADSGISVRMLEWKVASRIVSTCKRVVLLVAHGACVFHCLVDDSDAVEIIYYIHGVNLDSQSVSESLGVSQSHPVRI